MFAHLRATNPKTSPEQSEINKTNCSITRKTAPPPPLAAMFFDRTEPFANSTEIYIKPIFSPSFMMIGQKNVTSRVHVIQLTGTIFELNSHIKETNVLTKFHENWAKNVTFRRKMPSPLAAMYFSPICTIFELVRDINKTNVLTNFHDDWTKIVTSRVFTRNTAPATGGHVFHRTEITFELNQHIIKTNILTNFEHLTKFHEDRTINVASSVFTNKCGRTDDGQRPVTKAHLSNQTNRQTNRPTDRQGKNNMSPTTIEKCPLHCEDFSLKSGLIDDE
ncbi:hypothetical protein DPMN_124025 [Dreissena polymorpha]|uniref:Uncharacterized protein n=1 Tax=Dreissena polymorpha TaxID=45954 RepID=A0A9D4GVL4_DREPO|nr:hypothetical protein DPMN_124025 [Dreissena polymorpha]